MEKITKSSDKVLIDPNEPLILPDGTALVGRVEWFLYALCCLDYQNLPTPMSRIEEFANALITGEIPNIQPQSRAEQFFLAILDGNISDLPQPQSRSEVLLDKLARGEFDLSDVEPIQSSYELLLAYLIKNGGIGNIDYVLYEFSEAMKTMYNTVEKPFKSLELSGNTLVNCVLEDTENDDYVSFDQDYEGQSFTINGTSEGAIKSAILSGNTLVNKFDNKCYDLSNWSGSLYRIFYFDNLEVGKEYVFYAPFKGVHTGRDTAVQLKAGSRTLYQAYADSHETINVKFTLTDGERLHFDNYTIFGDALKVDYPEILILESKYYYDGISFFTGMQSVKMPVLTTTGKNLFDKNRLKEPSKWSGVWSEKLNLTDFNLKRGETYYFDVPFRIRWINGGVTLTEKTFDVKKEVMIPTDFDEVIFDVYIPDMTFEEYKTKLETAYITYGNKSTSYEPFKSNILSCNEEVTLRGIGDVKDTLNCLTSELTEYIGEIVLDGTQYMEADGRGIYIQVDDMKKVEDYRAIITCDKLPVFYHEWVLPNVENGISGYRDDENKYPGQNWFYIKVNNSIDVDEVRQMLIQNPITVQYGLSVESIKTVDLNVVDQNNNKIDKIHVFNETTHVNASSDELTPTVNIDKSVLYPTIIKPSTKYTVDLKRNDKPLTVNLGGTEVTFASGETRKTITTPSTLTNDKLSYYGVGAKCNEIMLIEGEVERNIDYFTGMQSVKAPTVSTVGSNLINLDFSSSWNSEKYDYEKLANGYILDNTIGRISYNRKLKNLIVGELYTFSCNIEFLQESDRNRIQVYFNSQNKAIYGGSMATDGELVWTFTYDQEYETFGIYFQTDGNIEPLRANITNVRINSGGEVLEYEPYKSSILSYNDDVTLRGIGDVRDTLDCLTGEIVERVGVGVFDGSEDEGWQLLDSNDNYVTFVTYRPLPNIKDNKNSICDKLPFQGHMTPEDGEYHSVQSFGSYINVLSSKASNVVEFKNWLSQNNLTIYYPLTTESIKTVDLSVVDQDGNTIPKVKSYNGTTHLEVTVSKQSLLPNVSAEVATDNSKDMSSLTTKHQEISETQSAIQDNIQFQSDEIDTALMATTEIFESILE